MMRTCNNCFVRKPFTDFHVNKANKDGIQYNCKPCASELVKSYRQNKIQKKWDKLYSEENKENESTIIINAK